MVANGHPEQSAGKCHRKYTAPALAFERKRGGKGEMVSSFAHKASEDPAKFGEPGRSGTVRAHRGVGDGAGRANPTACKTK